MQYLALIFQRYFPKLANVWEMKYLSLFPYSICALYCNLDINFCIQSHPFVGKCDWKGELKNVYLFNVTKNIILEHKQERHQL